MYLKGKTKKFILTKTVHTEIFLSKILDEMEGGGGGREQEGKEERRTGEGQGEEKGEREAGRQIPSEIVALLC